MGFHYFVMEEYVSYSSRRKTSISACSSFGFILVRNGAHCPYSRRYKLRIFLVEILIFGVGTVYSFCKNHRFFQFLLTFKTHFTSRVKMRRRRESLTLLVKQKTAGVCGTLYLVLKQKLARNLNFLIAIYEKGIGNCKKNGILNYNQLKAKCVFANLTYNCQNLINENDNQAYPVCMSTHTLTSTPALICNLQD